MKMEYVGMLVMVAALAGCATQARPQLYQGGYYMTGDAACVQGRLAYPGRIECMDKHRNSTGYRDALTPKQLQMYQLQTVQHQLAQQELNQQLRQMGQSFQSAGTQSQQVAVPAVAPLRTSDGVTYTRSGNTLIGSNGTTCQLVGETVICR